MTKKIFSLLFLLFFSFGITTAQKKAITHNDYDLWKIVDKTKISNKGKLIVSEIITRTERGDGYLQVYNTETKKTARFFNGSKSVISYDEKFIIFQKKVKYQTQRLEKKSKVKEEDRKKEVLYIYDAENNSIYDSITRVKSFKLPKKNSDYLVVEKFKNHKDSIKGDSLPAWKNNYALVYHLSSKQQDTLFNIKDVVIPEEGNTFYYTKKHDKRKKKAKGVYAYNTATKTKIIIDTSRYDYKKLAVNKQGNRLAFIADRDSTKTDSVPHKLYLYKDNRLKILADNEEAVFGKGQTLSGSKQLFFSENLEHLYFFTKVKSIHKKDTTLLDDEIPQVDVWNWKDEITQPRQKVNKKNLEEDNRLYVYHINENRIVKLQDDVIDAVELFDKYMNTFAIGVDYSPYAIETWKMPWERDIYAINLETGEKKLVLKKVQVRMDISVDGNYGVYFDIDTNDWISINLHTLKKHNMTQNIAADFQDVENDVPAPASAYGSGGFDKNGNLLLNSQYDIWQVSLDGKTQPKNITKNGTENKIVYRTRRLGENPLLVTYVDDKLLIKGFNEKNKAIGVYLLNDNGKLKEKIKPDTYLIMDFKKALEADVVTFTKQNFKDFEDVYVTTNSFKSHTKITNVNPHEKDFKWGTAELVSWNAYDGTKLEGTVYKPEDFDASKKYPLVTYFYEKSSDGFHNHYSPRPSASTIDRTYLVSNDYIVFVPDIVYNTGQPGDDAYNCVVSGVEMMEKTGYIDSSRMAIQGQSWGGYQVAYLITKTNKFRAAMAGAPVSNMTSAYGGIRWGSGLSRMFQYEKTQSRIGTDLWDGFDLYVKNSPLFHLPNVETPLLIMHNDNDGAVPYYQGIELFMGMRRLKKPVWMLVYNNEEHNLRKMKNKQDLSIRMMQFFDHYLKDAPAPIWMTKGVPRSEKGVNLGYDLDKE
ncbi:prolyl oligopeptidase family protein [Kordia periserrulae]|uniref:Prolyl oligopeptidase family protein n=1 Tax=Kordia periserrulae TaxID=701523 RepID=A0A2T6C5H9_9FLAO|nr:prolyl oligopeptidase family serine peptidase [Kordia periserrulae]PTX63542.1 prolyl oligopeptidase family protein [Kordia periserrulae]